MGRFSLILIIIGGVVFFMGFKEWRLAGQLKPQPRQITCQELSADGPGGNAHVVVTNFLLCPHFVYEEDRKARQWKRAWVPVVPLLGVYHREVLAMADEDGKLPDNVPLPKDIRLLLKINRTVTASDIDVLAERETIQGIVVNEIESLGSEEQRILAQSYPAIDFGKCHIVELDRKPPSLAGMYGPMGGGAAAALLGLGLLARAWLPKRRPLAAPPDDPEQYAQQPDDYPPQQDDEPQQPGAYRQ